MRRRWSDMFYVHSQMKIVMSGSRHFSFTLLSKPLLSPDHRHRPKSRHPAERDYSVVAQTRKQSLTPIQHPQHHYSILLKTMPTSLAFDTIRWLLANVRPWVPERINVNHPGHKTILLEE